MSTPPQGPPDESKVVINGGGVSRRLELAAGLLDETCEGIQVFLSQGGKFRDVGKIIRAANMLEDEAAAWDKKVTTFQKLVLAEMGYSGPLPKCMD